jgi:predicted methyltransferase
VGPEGHVYLLSRPVLPSARAGSTRSTRSPRNKATSPVVATDLTNFTLPEPVDLAWTTENYHDMHNGPTPSFAGINEATFRALKPAASISSKTTRRRRRRHPP